MSTSALQETTNFNKMAKVLIVLSLLYVSVHCAMSPELEKQMEDTKKMIQQVCQPKFKITDDQIKTAMDSKKVPDDKNFKCFLHCTLELTGMMTKNKLNFDNTRKQIEAFLPEEMKQPLLKTMDICEKKIEVAKNACDTAYGLALCFQENNPESPF